MTAATSRIAGVKGADSASVQALFQRMIEHWRTTGVRVVGLIEKTHGLPGRTCNAGVLRDIATGSPYPIFRAAVSRSDACHIDVAGAEIASKAVQAQIGTCDLVILSKFGKLEAARHGLIGAFEAAIKQERPVLTSVSDRHLQAWYKFAPDASVLEASPDALAQWWILMGATHCQGQAQETLVNSRTDGYLSGVLEAPDGVRRDT
jgi:nucleoside-triphosphatase THEP1